MNSKPDTQEQQIREREMESRVRAMADPEQETWDLSEKDMAALRHVLDQLTALRAQLEQQTGQSGNS
jgi:hypothetical protein